MNPLGDHTEVGCLNWYEMHHIILWIIDVCIHVNSASPPTHGSGLLSWGWTFGERITASGKVSLSHSLGTLVFSLFLFLSSTCFNFLESDDLSLDTSSPLVLSPLPFLNNSLSRITVAWFFFITVLHEYTCTFVSQPYSSYNSPRCVPSCKIITIASETINKS